MAEAGGAIIDHSVIEEIGYEGALIDLPAGEIARLAEREEVDLVVCDDIMFLRPQSLADVPAPGDETEPEAAIADEEPAELPPVAALFDGVPVQTTARYAHFARHSVKTAAVRIADNLAANIDTLPDSAVTT